MAASDVADPRLADAGEARIEWADGQMPVLRSIRERFAARAPARGPRGRRLPARDLRDRQPRAHAGGRAAPRWRSAPRTRSPRRTTSPPRWPPRAPRCTPSAATTPRPGRRGWPPWSRAAPQITLDDGADLLTALHLARPDLLDGLRRRHRGDHHRPRAAARPARRGQARLPGDRRQRGGHRARLQRPLRHRPVGARRHPAHHQPAARRAHARGARLRLGGQGDRAARRRARRLGDRLRGRPAARPRGADGRLRGAAGARGGRARRRVRDRHRRPRRPGRASTSRA